MSIVINIINYVFDMFILLIYFNHILKKRKDYIPVPFFYGAFIMMEFVMFANSMLHTASHTYSSYFITSSISFITTFALCFLYESTIKHKLFTSLLFQIFALLGEGIFSIIITRFKQDVLLLNDVLLNAIMNLGSKLILLLLVLACIFFWDKKIKQSIPSYNIMLFVTPAITLFITLSIPSSKLISLNLNSFYLSLFTSLIILNIVNYFMLDYVKQLTELRAKNIHMQQQITFQTEKYQQLSSAYRKSRSIVHDTKKHYFSIQSHIKNMEFDKLDEYLKAAITDLENTYAKINTGNLVIDAFVSNYLDMATEEGIQFDTDIHVDPDRIPVKDYDLCVILGNLLDNSLQACHKIIPPMKRYIQVQIYIDANDTFIIHLGNTTASGQMEENNTTDTLLHGYGLENVKTITESYHGMFSIIADQTYDVYVVIPIIEENKRKLIVSFSG
ncbi:MAG: GHKL domain-containing protein [Lachnospiraceae bacterium]|nr:GHKL domain-containing protein [Lachnospiraceae bacterium]